MTSDTQLSLRAQVHYDTLQNWYSGRTVPRPSELRKVADALGIRYADLQDAYDGRDPEPPTLVDAIEELIVELRAGRREQAEATNAILRTLGAALPELMTRGRNGQTDDKLGSLSVSSTSRRETVTKPLKGG